MSSKLSAACVMAFLVSVIGIGSTYAYVPQCSIPFKAIGKHCYYFSYPNTGDYIRGRETCYSMGATLAILDTQQKNAAVQKYLTSKYASGYFYIGGYEQPGHQGDFFWDPISMPFSYTYWNTGRPYNYNNGARCVTLYRNTNGTWYDMYCSNSYYYICQRISNRCYYEEHPPAYSCNAPFVRIGNKCYLINTYDRKSSTWLNAKEYCEQRNSTLAILDSASINGNLTKYLQAYYPGFNFWIGAYDARHEQRWVWNGSGNNVTFSNWYPGTPRSSSSSNCAIVDSEKNYAWYDENCYSTYSFVCQQIPDYCVNPYMGL